MIMLDKRGEKWKKGKVLNEREEWNLRDYGNMFGRATT